MLDMRISVGIRFRFLFAIYAELRTTEQYMRDLRSDHLLFDLYFLFISLNSAGLAPHAIHMPSTLIDEDESKPFAV